MQQQQKKSVDASAIAMEDIANLLCFQDNLLALFHSKIYSQQNGSLNQNTALDQSILNLQINQISQINDTWKRVIDDLFFKLIRQKHQYDTILRDSFQRLLVVDYLPCIRINRHEITQVSLFGFDIYVQPLTSILEILNRLQNQNHILAQICIKMKDKQRKTPTDIWQSIKFGWDYFKYEATLFKISLHVYILKQYLKLAGKSIIKKDKEIVFTGCTNLFSNLVPLLKQHNEIELLYELSILNNQLSSFHQSFNLSYFYILLLPLQNRYQPIFQSLKAVGEKCLNANILTPLLFALMKNRQSFLDFISQADDQIWAPYLDALVFGLIYNFKIRILQYEQIMQILEKAVLKLGMLNKLNISYFAGDIGAEWLEARDFFISAIKLSSNLGQSQTWHQINSENLQQRILKVTKDSLLLQNGLSQNPSLQIYFPKGFEIQVQPLLLQISGGLLNMKQLKCSFSPNIIQSIKIDTSKIIEVLKLGNLLTHCKILDSNSVCYYISILNKISAQNRSVDINSKIKHIKAQYFKIGKRILEDTENGEQDLKQILTILIKNNYLFLNVHQVIPVLLFSSNPKQALSLILQILAKANIEEQQIQQKDVCKQVAASLISIYYIQQTQKVRIRTFHKEYLLSAQNIYLGSKLHSSINFLLQNYIWNGCSFAKQIILYLVRASHALVIPLLSFPITIRYDKNQNERKLESFSIWLILNSNEHLTLSQFISIGLLLGKQLRQYFLEVVLPTICDQIINQINKVLHDISDIQDTNKYISLLNMISLFTKVYKLIKNKLDQNKKVQKQTIKLYLKVIEKLALQNQASLSQSLADIIRSSIIQIYPQLLDIVLDSNENSRKWRICMKKLCLNSFDLSIQHYSNIMHYQIPSIKRDKGYFVEPAIDTPKITKSMARTTLNSQTMQKIESLIYCIRAYDQLKNKQTNQSNFLNSGYLLTHEQVRQYINSQDQPLKSFKQFIFPDLPHSLITEILMNSSQIQSLSISNLISLSPSNHQKLVKICLESGSPKDKQILMNLSLSKQTTQSSLIQILQNLSQSEMSIMVECLDNQSKKSISESFNFLFTKQEILKNQNMDFILRIISGMADSFDFLIYMNRTNWRLFNELVSELSEKKLNGFFSASSAILQYYQYIKITGKSNTDYEKSICSFEKIIRSFRILLMKKKEYLNRIQNGSNLKVQQISKQQIRLLKNNEVSYINSFVYSWNIEQFLLRAAQLHKYLFLSFSNLQPFSNITFSLNRIFQSLVLINSCLNELVEGGILCSEFIHTNRMCSQRSVYQYKNQLGQNLEKFISATGTIDDYKIGREYIFESTGKKLSLQQYLNFYASPKQQGSKGTEFLNIQVKIQEINSLNLKRKIQTYFTQALDDLEENKILCKTENRLEFKGYGSQETEKTLQIQQIASLYHFGILYRLLEVMKIQNNHKYPQLVDKLRQRQMLPWQILRQIDLQSYHNIKSILIDQNIQERKINYAERFKKQGSKTCVNKLNKEKYCNHIAISCIGETYYHYCTSFVQGLHSVKLL